MRVTVHWASGDRSDGLFFLRKDTVEKRRQTEIVQSETPSNSAMLQGRKAGSPGNSALFLLL